MNTEHSTAGGLVYCTAEDREDKQSEKQSLFVATHFLDQALRDSPLRVVWPFWSVLSFLAVDQPSSLLSITIFCFCALCL